MRAQGPVGGAASRSSGPAGSRFGISSEGKTSDRFDDNSEEIDLARHDRGMSDQLPIGDGDDMPPTEGVVPIMSGEIIGEGSRNTPPNVGQA